MSASTDSTNKPPENPIDSEGLTDLGPAQPEDPPHPPQADADLRDPPSPAGVPRPDDR
ncbi:hypothetical protein [Caballeronia sp. SL2Y3]|uniref:hypothetical protein n=1 Tax=Caballeronia sp. SL2Y3 TaxID=2878151 RepID=UPI001FD3B8AD|nr:hypothetical protein [Caballeronia sp. SL2Y3]